MFGKKTYQPLPIDESDGLPFNRRIFAVIAIGFALFMSVLDGNIMNVMLPTLARDFNVTPSMTTWIVNSFQLAIVVSLLSFSSLGDIFGYRKVYLWGISVFCITSLICAFSNSFWTLTIARTFQGLGASALTSVNTAQLRYIYPKRLLGRGIGLNAMIVSIAAAAGPTVAGGVISIASWHWLFIINIPFGLIALILGIQYLPRIELKIKRKFDYISSIANAITFGLFIYTVDGFCHREKSAYLYILLAVVLFVGIYYVHRELHQKSPLLPLDLLQIPIFRLSIITSICSFAAQMLALISLPFFLQNQLGYNTITIGLLLTSWPLTSLFAALLAGFLVERFHPGILGCIGMGIFAIGLISLSFVTIETSFISIIPRLMLCGAGFSLFQTPNNSTIISSAPPSRSGGASGMQGMARLFGQTFGTTMVAFFFSTIVPEKSAKACLIFGTTLAVIAAVVSILRISQPSALKKK